MLRNIVYITEIVTYLYILLYSSTVPVYFTEIVTYLYILLHSSTAVLYLYILLKFVPTCIFYVKSYWPPRAAMQMYILYLY